MKKPSLIFQNNALKICLVITVVFNAGLGTLIPTKILAQPSNVYWVGGSGNWSDASDHWASSSGGSPNSANEPDSSTNVHFDTNSFTAAGQTVTIDTSSASCYDMDWTGATNNPTFSHGSSSSLYTYGILTFISAMTVSYIGIVDYGPQISSGTNLYDLTAENPLTLESPLTLNELIVNSSFNANKYCLNCSTYFNALGSSGTVNFTGSTITANSFWLNGLGLALIATGSTINVSQELLSNGFNFDNVNVNGSCNITGSNSFVNFTVTRGAASKIVTEAGTTQTFDNFSCPAVGADVVSIMSGTPGSPATWAKANGDPVNLKYIYVQDNGATPANIWSGDINSGAGSDVSGWTGIPPSIITSTTGATNITNAGSALLAGTVTGLGSPAVSSTIGYFNYGTTSSYGSSTSQQTLTALGNFYDSISGLSAGTYHYQAVELYGGLSIYGADSTFTIPNADSAPKNITPFLQSGVIPGYAGDGSIVYNGYVYICTRSLNELLKISDGDYTEQASVAIPSLNDALVEAGGYIWVGAGDYIYELDPNSLVTMNTIFTANPYSASACTDGTNVYFGSLANNNICSVNISTLAVNIGTVADAKYGIGIHELAVDSTYLYGDLAQGEGMFKANKTTLTNVAEVAGTGTLDSEEIFQDSAYVYNMTESTTSLGQIGVYRWAKSNLAYTFCPVSMTDVGLDSGILLANGELIVGSCQLCTYGTCNLYVINPNFTYTGQNNEITGINYEAGRLNRILQDGAYLTLIVCGATSSDYYPLSILKINATDISLLIAITENTTSLPNAIGDTNYAQWLSASGGIANYTWSIVSGALPDGFTLNNDGVISGKIIHAYPPSPHTYNFTVRVTDADDATATQSLSITVNCPPWDVNNDGITDISDIVMIGLHWNVTMGGPNYDPNCDVDGNGVININDVVIVGLHWDQSW